MAFFGFVVRLKKAFAILLMAPQACNFIRGVGKNAEKYYIKDTTSVLVVGDCQINGQCVSIDIDISIEKKKRRAESTRREIKNLQ